MSKNVASFFDSEDEPIASTSGTSRPPQPPSLLDHTYDTCPNNLERYSSNADPLSLDTYILSDPSKQSDISGLADTSNLSDTEISSLTDTRYVDITALKVFFTKFYLKANHWILYFQEKGKTNSPQTKSIDRIRYGRYKYTKR